MCRGTVVENHCSSAPAVISSESSGALGGGGERGVPMSKIQVVAHLILARSMAKDRVRAGAKDRVRAGAKDRVRVRAGAKDRVRAEATGD